MQLLNRTVVATVGMCLLLAWGAGLAWAENHYFYGDMNCDEKIDFEDIDPFVLALSDPVGYAAVYPHCELTNGDINGDGKVNFGDIDPFVERLADPGPYVRQNSNSGCLGDSGGGCRDPDEFVLTVKGHTLHVLHRNATYNCCPDEIVISLSVQGNTLNFIEEEILPNPAYCICCYELEASAANLSPGTYKVVFCWFDYETWQIQCYEDQIKIP